MGGSAGETWRIGDASCSARTFPGRSAKEEVDGGGGRLSRCVERVEVGGTVEIDNGRDPGRAIVAALVPGGAEQGGEVAAG